MEKIKGRIFKAAREKQLVTYRGTPIRIPADFSAETLQTRREWHDIFKVMKGERLQPKILYPARLFSFRLDGEIKSFTGRLGFPGEAVVKNPPANAGDMGLSPGPGRSHMPRNN